VAVEAGVIDFWDPMSRPNFWLGNTTIDWRTAQMANGTSPGTLPSEIPAPAQRIVQRFVRYEFDAPDGVRYSIERRKDKTLLVKSVQPGSGNRFEPGTLVVPDSDLPSFVTALNDCLEEARKK
jgi:hypothetical protein